MNKILLWTYNPFENFKRNAAKDFVALLPKKYKRIILDTDYNLNPLFKKISECKPKIVLGVGQSSKKIVEVESNFRNRIKFSGEDRIISEVESFASNLPVEKMAQILSVSVSNNAGTRNCNSSAYRLLDEVNNGKLDIKVGFIHVPNTKYFRKLSYLPRFVEMLEFLRRYDFDDL